MKRYTALILSVALALVITGCAAQSSQQKPDSETPGGTPSERSQILITYNGSGTGEFYLTTEEARVVNALLEQSVWTENPTAYTKDVVISLPDLLLGYYSETGVFTDSANRRSMTLNDEDRAMVNEIFSRYMTLGTTSIAPPTEPVYDWGITLTLKDLTPGGATIVCTQSGGNPTGELNTGSYYIVERLTEYGWEEVEQLPLDGELAWTAEARLVNMDGTTEWEVNWAWLYGELPNGHYRIGKEFMDFRGTGDYDEMMVYAEFSFGEMPIEE